MCRDEYRINTLGYYCLKCKKIQDLINIYGDRVHEVLEEVLVRTNSQQENKLKQQIKKEIKRRKNRGEIGLRFLL